MYKIRHLHIVRWTSQINDPHIRWHIWKKENDNYWRSNHNTSQLWIIAFGILSQAYMNHAWQYHESWSTLRNINSWYHCSRQNSNRDGLVSLTFDNYYPINVASIRQTECSLCWDAITQHTIQRSFKIGWLINIDIFSLNFQNILLVQNPISM